jgi:hypothetical protein
MNAVRNVTLAVVLSAVAALSSASQARADFGDTFAAIAYSPSTGHVGYAYNASSQRAAERAALEQCNRSDAEVVVVVKNGYAALAVGEDGSYGYAWGSSRAIAESIALQKCLEVGGVRPRIVLSIYSGD